MHSWELYSRTCILIAPSSFAKLERVTIYKIVRDLNYARIKSKLQQPPPSPPGANPGHLNLWRLDRSNSRPIGPKWCSNALPYRRICLSNAPAKEQSPSVPLVCNKDCAYSRYAETLINNYSPRWRWIVVEVVVVGIWLAAKRRGKDPPLFTDTEVNNNKLLF